MHPSCFGFLLQEVVDIWSPFSIITLRIVDWDRVTWFAQSQESSATAPKLGPGWSRWLEQGEIPGGSLRIFPDDFDKLSSYIF